MSYGSQAWFGRIQGKFGSITPSGRPASLATGDRRFKGKRDMDVNGQAESIVQDNKKYHRGHRLDEYPLSVIFAIPVARQRVNAGSNSRWSV